MGLQTDHRFTLAMVAAVDDLVLQGAASPPIPETNRSCQEHNSGSIQKGLLIPARRASICTRTLRWDVNRNITVGSI